MKRILVAGIGNIFQGDDAFGVEVARRLAQRPQPDGVRVVDFGTRSYDLAYALTDDYDVIILVDAVQRGQPPGTLYLIEPDTTTAESSTSGAFIDAHGMNPMLALQMVRMLGGTSAQLYLVACEPEILETEDLGLSPTVAAVIPCALEMIESLIRDLLTSPPSEVATYERR